MYIFVSEERLEQLSPMAGPLNRWMLKHKICSESKINVHVSEFQLHHNKACPIIGKNKVESS